MVTNNDLHTTCAECGSAKNPSPYRICKACHRSNLAGYRRMGGRPFYLKPLERI